ncbi:MAG: family 20 glycosylhydrolase [Lentisphaeria bacterium]|nr:family 20 glycosylhydrolase [Lentisphaeria bacterium]
MFISLVADKNSLPQNIIELAEALAEDYPIAFAGQGTKVTFNKIEADGIAFKVAKNSDGFVIDYNCTAACARGIASALAGICCEESTPMNSVGAMLDVSRGMVMKVDRVKKYLRRMAMSGCNLLLLYAEDVYEVPGEPFFGRHRGAYTMAELKELDAYAGKVGIELVGCIQTLGHMEQLLRWSNVYSNVMDTGRELLAESPETYKLIEKILDFWSEALTSRRLHIGMDETQSLGRGKYLTLNGYKNPFEILGRHLEKVNALCLERGLKPMIWSDMYFRFNNPEHNYYDYNNPLPANLKKDIPSNVSLVYWDYYHQEEEIFEKMIMRHREIGFEPIVASGVWTWATLWHNHHATKSTVPACVNACRRENIKELFFTMWGDDGAYCNYDSLFFGFIFAMEQVFCGGIGDNAAFKARYEAIMKGSFEAADIASHFVDMDFICSLMIWDDPLLNIYYDQTEKTFGTEHMDKSIGFYAEMAENLKPYADEFESGDFGHLINILNLLSQKMIFVSKLKKAYYAKDIKGIKEAKELLVQLMECVRKFDASFRRQWMRTAKVHGLERIQLRNSGLLGRLEETERRLTEYLTGEIAEIAELERPETGELNSACNLYAHVASGAAKC